MRKKKLFFSKGTFEKKISNRFEPCSKWLILFLYRSYRYIVSSFITIVFQVRLMRMPAHHVFIPSGNGHSLA